MKNKLLYLFCCLVFVAHSNNTTAQGENNIWAFADSIGLDFNSGEPTVLKTHSNAFESVATISDSKGNLLFYASANAGFLTNCVRNSLHNIMPNGDSILGNKTTSAHKGFLILPFQNGSNKYFLFSLTASEERSYLNRQTYCRYSIVDMSLNGGLGDVVPGQKNLIVDSFTSESMELVRASDCSVWLILPRADTTVFRAYKIDETNNIYSPVISGFPSTKSSIYDIPDPNYLGAQIAFNPVGNLLVYGQYQNPKIDLFDFDLSTGKFSNQRLLDTVKTSRLQFSPDGSKLYSNQKGIMQYDFSLMPNINAILENKRNITKQLNYYDFRIGPDDKLYTVLCSTNPVELWRFSKPNLDSSKCEFSKFLNLPIPPSFSYGLGNNVLVNRINRRKDSIVCFSKEAMLNPSINGDSYLWNDNSTEKSLKVSSSGKYWVVTKKGCNVYSDTFQVEFITSNSSLAAFDSICNSDTLNLNAETPNATYQWQDGSTKPSFKAIKEGKYFVTIKVEHCSKTDSIEIFKKELKLNLGNDQKLCEGEVITLEAKIENANYLWQDGSRNQTLRVSRNGNYWVQVSKENCIATDTINVAVVNCSNCIAIPNAFSPNQDNKNDFFKPIINCPTQDFTLKIFNRYGQEVFSTNNPMDKWDGIFNNKELEFGVYYYFVKVKFDIPNAKEEMFKGDITLLR